MSNCWQTQTLRLNYVSFQIAYNFEKRYKIDKAKVCLSACVSLASDSSETIEAIIIKLGMVTASEMVMHRVLILLTLTFIQVTYTDHE